MSPVVKRLLSRLGAVQLHYSSLLPTDQTAPGRPLVILHGLLRNWLSLSKAFLRDLQRPIYTLDLRNHGTSPHASPMTYTAMASDVLNFCQTHSLSQISLLGHSMGGKVAMALALDPNLPANLLSHLVVADMTPAKGSLSDEFRGYIAGMKEIEENKVATRKGAHEVLFRYEPDPAVRDFLLTNFVPASSDNPNAAFRVPLDILDGAIPELGSFPYEPGERSWDGKTLVVKGSKSKYVNRHNIPLMNTLFPNTQIEVVEAGHWVHAESPHEFKRIVTDFVRV